MTFSCGLLHTDEQVLDVRLELFLQQLCTDTWWSLEDLPNSIDDSDEWRGRVREICAHVTTWWGSYKSLSLYIYIYSSIISSKTLIHRNKFPTDPNKKIKLIIYYNKFKTSNLIIKNNSSPSIGVLRKTNVIYYFKCPFGDCISENYNICIGLTSTTLSRMHLSDTNSIAPHLKNIHAQQQNYGKFLTKTQHSKYCYVSPTVQLNISHLFTHR